MKYYDKLIVLCIAFFLCGCAETDEISDFTHHQAAIHNGRPASDSKYSAVVSIAVRANDVLYSFCSGVLIENDTILTAAHCMMDENGFPFESFYKSGQIVVAAGDRISSIRETAIYPIDEYLIHPKFKPDHHDLALIRLKTPIPDDIIPPMTVYHDKSRLQGFAHFNQNVDFCGYGYDSESQDGTKLHIEGTVQQYCAWADENDCGMPLDNGKYLVVPAGSFVHNIQNGGPCQGDSGAPVIIMNHTEPNVIGIVSFGDTECSIYSVSMSTADHYEWIHDSIYGSSEDDGCSATPMHSFSWIQRLSVIIMLLGMFVALSLIRRKPFESSGSTFDGI